MTRIDFHSNVPEKIHYACRLVRKARTADCRVVVFAERADLAALDTALWTFMEQEFVPHVMANDALAARTPVILTDSDTAELPHHEVLINLSNATPSNFASFERLLEIVSTEENEAAAGRERYRFYKQRGYPLNHFVAEKS
ncbi:MAG: DNA polymerase III subunit chi [Burkholderiales bacterium]|nr:DNA polymerase III subunit chi [Burkholderiales bacterium]